MRAKKNSKKPLEDDMEDLTTAIIAHELNNSADFRQRDKFYDQIARINHLQKENLKLKLKKINGADFAPVLGATVLKETATYKKLMKFSETGYLYPLELKKEYLDQIYLAINDLPFTNRMNGEALTGQEILMRMASQDKVFGLDGTYWLSDGTPENQKFILSDVMQRIAFDPEILKIVAHYLGSTPIHVATNAWASGVASDQKEISRNAQEFHQDCGFAQFVKVFIYLSDTQEVNGPHRFVSGSCRRDNYQILPDYYESKRVSESELKQYYDGSDFITICGKQGTVIIGDTSCFHKGMPVVEGSRLVLNLEYTSTLFGSSVGYFSGKPIEKHLNHLNDLNRSRVTKNYQPHLVHDYMRYNSNFNSLRRRILKKIKKTIRIT